MGKTLASKERHEGCLERRDALKEVSQGPLPADGIAHQGREKIDGRIRSQIVLGLGAPGSRKSLQQSLACQVTNNHDDFGEPRWHRRSIHRRGLNLNPPGGYHRERDLRCREKFLFPSQ